MASPSTPIFRRILVALFCIGVGSAAGYYLYLDFSGGDDVAPGSGIAIINKSQNAVRKRSSKSFLWRRADQGQELQLKDSIQTAEDSAAAVSLKTGELIEIGANSLFVLNNSSDLSLGFLQGSVIVGENGQSFKYETDAKTGQIKKIMLPASLSSPLPFADYFSKVTHWVVPLRFKWSADESQASSGKIEISRTKEFQNPILIEATRIKESIFGAVAEIDQDGEWFWRVTSQGKAVSQERSFKTFNTFVLNPLHPNEGEAVASVQKSASVAFSWRPYKGLVSKESKHQIEVSESSDFKTLLLKNTIDPTLGSAQVGPLSFGNHYWRIKSDFSGSIETSEAKSFNIKPKRDFIVTLHSPKEASIVSIDSRLKTEFSWTPDDFVPDLNYQVEFQYQDSQGKIQSFSKQSPTNRLAIVLPSTGKYSWKVISIAKTLKIGTTTPLKFYAVDSKPLEIVKPSPRETFYYWTEKTPLNFSWKDPNTNKDYSRYRVEISDRPDFSQIVASNETKNLQVAMKGLAQDGKYYWRVTALDDNQNTAASSLSQDFSYALHPPIEGPIIEASQASRKPASLMGNSIPSFNVFDDPSPIKLTWPDQDKRVFSQVKVVRREENKRTLVFETRTKTGSVTLPNLKPGQYEASLTPMDILKRSGVESVPSLFDVTLGEPLRAPRALSAEVQ